MEQTSRSFFLFPPFFHTQRLSGVYRLECSMLTQRQRRWGERVPSSLKNSIALYILCCKLLFSLNNMSKTFPISAHTFVAHFSKNNIVVHFIERYHGSFIHPIINDCYGMSDFSQLKNNATHTGRICCAPAHLFH